MGDDKPFECTVTGCGMKFTNEDHLTVHKTKHQLTLTLVPNEFKGGQTPGFVDQTPTPSKFLKNFEEVTLFHDFSKNPFEEAFKKATEQPSPCADLDSSNSPSAYDTLNTPNPGFLVAIVDNKHSDHDSSSQGHHRQQSTFTSSEHSFFLLPPPSCSTGELTNQNSDWSSMDIDHDGNHHHQQNVEVTVCNPINNVENVLYVGNSSLQHGTVDLNSVPANTGCITYLLANDTLVPISLPSITKDDAPLSHEKSDDKQNMQGTRVRQKPLHVKSVTPNSHEVIKGKRLIKIQPSPSSRILAGKTTLSTPNKSLSAKNGIARTTKEKLKATIQQNVQQQQQQQQASNASSILDGVDFIPQKQHVSSSSSSIPSSSSSTWNMSYVVSNAEAKEIEECEDVVGSLLTGKKICLIPVEEERDDKRRKFLERNRAAAARCRQKKKVWMNTLALKSEQLEAVNKNMQNELKHLRKEVQLLRSLLETHKECPVTLKQRALKEEMQSNHVTSSSSATANGVGVIITTSDEELAMNALSNMASYAG